MEKVALGSSGIMVSRLCQGAWNFAGGPGWGPDGEQTAIALLRTALDRGVNFIDTARGYGKGVSEQIVGKAVAGRRSECVIATKMLCCPPEEVDTNVDESLKCLGTDYIDLYICHWPRPSVPLEPWFERMVRVRESGKVRAIGVSNFDLAQMRVAQRYGAVSLQPPYSILWRVPDEVLAFCREKNIAVTPYSPLAQGLLAGRFTRQAAELSGIRAKNLLFADKTREAALAVARQVDAVADRLGCTSSQVALAWLLRCPGTIIPIVGASRLEQLEENLAAVDVRLPDADFAALDRAGRKVWEMIGPDESMWGWKPA